MAFWHWKKEPTLAEQAVSAVDRISQDIDELRSEREMTLGCFRCAAESLRDINEELGSEVRAVRHPHCAVAARAGGHHPAGQ